MSPKISTQVPLAESSSDKIDTIHLDWVLGQVKQRFVNGGVITGFESREDCAVFDNGKEYTLLTTHFSNPLIDNPYAFGFSVAANCLNNIFAMGGHPLTSTTILACPEGQIPSEDIHLMICGGNDAMDQASCQIVGGHSVYSPQLIYGFSVSGKVDYDFLKSNNSAQEGDLLILTKPLGVGVYTMAHRLGLLSSELTRSFLNILQSMSLYGQSIASLPGVSAMTDVGGCGLVGHCLELCQRHSVAVELKRKAIPFYESAVELMEKIHLQQIGVNQNITAYRDYLEGEVDLSSFRTKLLFDPQSNGGLLVSVRPESYESLLDLLAGNAWVIGRVISSNEGARVFIDIS